MEPVLLVRPGPEVPWGFRLNGGTDQQQPLTVQRVTPGSVASQGLIVGDKILRIGNSDSSTLSYSDAMELIKSSGDRLQIYTARSGAPQSNHEDPRSSQPSHVDSNGLDLHHQSAQNQGQDHTDYDHHRGPETAGPPEHHQGSTTAQVPDAVLNIAARTAQDKRPWTYVPDMQSLQQQRRRVQRRNYGPSTEIPIAPVYKDHSYSPQVQRSRPVPPSQTQGEHLGSNDVEGVEKSIYGGPEIPSRTFQMLHSYTSNINHQSGNTDLARAAERRQKRRERLQNANSTVYNDDGGRTTDSEFDEAAYLAGKISIVGQKAPQISTPSFSRTEQNEEEEEEERNDDKPFDERAYLAGRIPLVRGGPIDPTLFDLPLPASSSSGRGEEKEANEDDNESKKPFDERAYLAGRIPLVKGGTIDPTQFNVPEKRVVRRHRDLNRPRLKQPFDERAYLSGQLNILGQPPSSQRTRVGVPPQPSTGNRDSKPSWYKTDEDMVSEDEYDEDSFLRGKFSIVRRSVDRELPPRKGVLNRSNFGRERASWERENPEDEAVRGGTTSETEFDENAFLYGRSRRRVVAEKEYSTDTEVDAPSKTLRILRRSVSSERSADDYTGWRSSSERALSGDESGSDQEKPLNYLMYQGRNIPSKIFSRLKKTMDRKAEADRAKIRPSDPIERLKNKSLENLGIDVDTALERLETGKSDPNAYMEMLKKSVEANQNDFRIEPEAEVTDF